MPSETTEPFVIFGVNIFSPDLCPPDVQSHLGSLARTEDLRFSPDGKWLAIAGFGKQEISLFNVDWTSQNGSDTLILTAHTRITSEHLRYPHGLDFIDATKLVIANRQGFGEVFDIPTEPRNQDSVHLTPVATVQKVGFRKKLRSPGSVVVVPNHDQSTTLLFCNNYANLVSRHELSFAGISPSIARNSIAAQVDLKIPDGIARCPVHGNIAVSNHRKNNILVYENLEAMTPKSTAPCVLSRINYPHGLRFTKDGRYLFVADAGQPFVNIYARESGWLGEKHPVAYLRIMSDAQYLTGHVNPEEGGAKGLELDPENRVLMVTSEFQALAVFDLPQIIAQVEAHSRIQAKAI